MKKKSIRSIVLDYVKTNGPQTYSSLQQVVLIAARQPLSRKKYGSSYIDKVSFGTSALLPTETDSRYLVKSHFDGMYHLVNE